VKRAGQKRLRPDELRPETKMVLAALVLAAMWRERFPDGTLTLAQLREVGAYVGSARTTEGIKATIRRALTQLRTLRDRVSVRAVPQPSLSKHGRMIRQAARRLQPPVPLSLELWLLGEGLAYIDADVRKQFEAARQPAVDSTREILAGLEETIVRRNLSQGQHDRAIERARAAVDAAPTPRIRIALSLSLATALFRRGTSRDVDESLTLLDDLLAHAPEPLDEHDQLLAARIGISWSFCRFFADVASQPEPAIAAGELQRIGELLDQAEAAAGGLNLSDRAQIANLRGLLSRYAAERATNRVDREEMFDRADRLFHEAVTVWRMAQDSYGLGAVLFNLGELRRIRYRLSHGEGTRQQVSGALLWYEASIHYGEEVGPDLSWVLDFLRAAECIAITLTRWREDLDPEAVPALLNAAREYLRRAGTSIPRDSWQGRLRTRVEAAVQQVAAEGGGQIGP
jgi:tetratricopeptide (TPR) repeat protein